MSSLSTLTNLTGLFLGGNNITDVSALSTLTKLTRLFLGNNNISDLSPLVANTGLSSDDYIDVSNNPLSDLSRNTHIPALQERGVEVQFGTSKPAIMKIERSMIPMVWETRVPIHDPTGGKRKGRM